jgi:predicted  nucleic acid-binding Zn-ribbon protein
VSDTNHAPARASRRGSLKQPSPAIASPPSRELAAAQAKAAGEIASLVRLAELDAELLDSEGRRREPPSDAVAHERHRLAAKLSAEILEAYNRALRAGRRPAVVRLAGNVCSGCNVRLHSTLEQKVRRRRGVGACPHCLRLVYDPVWLHRDDPR